MIINEDVKADIFFSDDTSISVSSANTTGNFSISSQAVSGQGFELGAVCSANLETTFKLQGVNRYMHYYDSAGTYTVKIYTPIENIINAPTGYKYLFSNVQAVTFPDSLISIGTSAFANNPIEADIDFNNVETILANAFSGDSAVYGDTISELYGKEVVKITDSAFYKKRYLTKIDFPNAEYINNSSFSYCTKLTDVNIPSVKWIASYAFQNCTSLESIEIPDTIEEISYNNGLYTNAFQGCTNLKTIRINKPKDRIAGSPWGATNATAIWTG